MLNSLEEFSTCTLVKCCARIQATCVDLISTNLELKRNLADTQKEIPNPTTQYVAGIEKNITNAADLKYSLIKAVEKAHTLVQQVHDCSSCLAKKNHHVYPSWNRVSHLLNEAQGTKEKNQ